jgi:hypothetical protein
MRKTAAVEAGAVTGCNMHSSYRTEDISDLYDCISNTHGGVSCDRSCTDKDRVTLRYVTCLSQYCCLPYTANS